ncbi:uncharacterized protein LOC124273501 [Haliotis rubra]|uniref:uncharacterized protein LOC124273501 n=1 Tax=Haliotis rubra TaxID=36100 RepID=UPI001EE53BCD|nr:uncharacterized protein LOC124273501 [Haliotis rubra]
MLLPILLSSVSLALGQFLFTSNAEISRRNGYQFEYHPDTKLLTVKNIFSCYFVGTDESLRTRIRDKNLRTKLQDELIGFIQDNRHIIKTSLVQAGIAHNDPAATSSCVGDNLFELEYPSKSTTATQGQTTIGRTKQGHTTRPTTQGSTA